MIEEQVLFMNSYTKEIKRHLSSTKAFNLQE